MRFSLTSMVLRMALFLPLMTILLASCAVGPNFHMPSVASPDAFRDAPSAASTNSLADLPWGSVFQDEAARAGLLASQETQHGVRLTLLSEVAAGYIQLLELDERLEIAHHTEKSFERTFKLFDDQHKNGFASKLEVSRASAALHSVSATIPDLRRQIALKENEINVLLGQNPGPVARERILLKQETLPEVPTGLPAMLLQRRPDIRAAEQQLRAANARIGVSVGDFFPRIGLTALYGGVSTELSALTSGGANAWSLAATATGPRSEERRVGKECRSRWA